MFRFLRSIRPTGRLILFVLLSTFLVAQVSWWVVYQNRTAQHIADLQEEVWTQEIRVAERILDQFNALPADSHSVFIQAVFSDLEVDPATGEITVLPASRHQLAAETTDVARMFAFESATFVVIILAGMLYMYATLRREVAVERQYANFLSAVTHELRSPVAALKLLLEALRPLTDIGTDPDDSLAAKKAATQRDTVMHQMTRSLDRLHALIERLLRARQLMSSGSARPTLERIDLRTETERALRDMASSRPGMDRRVTAELASISAPADAQSWRILVTNLVENALKYSGESDPVTVSLAVHKGSARLVVRDEGIGFATRERHRIFRRFYRVGDEDTRGSVGSGLGLYLVREAARSMKGNVTADSPGKGKGATFTVRIPKAVAT